jgi:hypothetical protein
MVGMRASAETGFSQLGQSLAPIERWQTMKQVTELVDL